MKLECTVRIETERLILRPFVMEDAAAMYRNWAGDSEVTKYLTWPPHESEDATRQLLEGWIAEYVKPDFFQWAIELRESGEAIGSISIVRMQENTMSAEVGWCIGRRWWNRGIMTEAASALLEYLFEKAGFARVSARHDPNNPASGRVMQKIGMRYEGTLRRCDVNNQGIVDTACYGLSREEYENGAETFRPMRRSAQSLDEAECAAILEGAASGVLAVYGDGGYPYTVPVSHVYKDGRLYFHCAKTGHKLDAIRRCDRVSFCVIDRDEVRPDELTTRYVSVIVFGRARIVSDEPGLRHIAGLMAAKYAAEHAEAARKETEEAIAADRLRGVEITVEHMSGKCARELMAERRRNG